METKRFYGNGEIILSDCGFMYLDGKDIAKIICDTCLGGSNDKRFFGLIEIIIKRPSVIPFSEVDGGAK